MFHVKHKLLFFILWIPMFHVEHDIYKIYYIKTILNNNYFIIKIFTSSSFTPYCYIINITIPSTIINLYNSFSNTFIFFLLNYLFKYIIIFFTIQCFTWNINSFIFSILWIPMFHVEHKKYLNYFFIILFTIS